ncbi:MAG: sulfur carrier protein ThiS [Myxococcota bacterium]
MNGERKTFIPPPSSVEALLERLALPSARVAVELNGALVRRAERGQTELRSGDVIEVVTLVGGG